MERGRGSCRRVARHMDDPDALYATGSYRDLRLLLAAGTISNSSDGIDTTALPSVSASAAVGIVLLWRNITVTAFTNAVGPISTTDHRDR
jgi:hypothetical protein